MEQDDIIKIRKDFWLRKWNWVKQNYALILVSLIFIFTLLILQLQVGTYMQKCNDHWKEQIKDNCDERRDLCAALIMYNKTLNATPFIDYDNPFKWVGG